MSRRDLAGMRYSVNLAEYRPTVSRRAIGRTRNRIDLRKDHEEPAGPEPRDYLCTVKEWLEDGWTSSQIPFEVLVWSSVNHLWVCSPLP
jgi:hypothetical protein